MVTQQVTWSPKKENIQGSFLTGDLRKFVWSAKAKWMVGAGSLKIPVCAEKAFIDLELGLKAWLVW